MPYLWIEEEGGWAVMRLRGGAASLGEGGIVPPSDRAPILVRVDASGARWVLLAPPDGVLRVNGTRMSGIRLLEHGDELSLGRRQFSYSSERRARVEPFDGLEAIACGRCSVEIEPGMPCVRCPQCGILHHARPDHDCWNYAPTCIACDFPTRAETEFRWTPERV